MLLKIAYGTHVLVTSPFLLREAERVLSYPRLQKLWHLTGQDVQQHIQLLAKMSELVQPVIGVPVVLKDPNDDPVVYAAVSGKADVLCTLDRDFFDLEVLLFCRNRGIAVQGDVETLRQLTTG